jgi:CYTH domain-containing protein
MQLPKYAQLENERRFLIAKCPDLSKTEFRVIEDLYISGSRLRLRMVTHNENHASEFKLCKKYPTTEALSGPIVNVYLTASEHMMLAQLGGTRLRKRRYRLKFAAKTFVLDIFEDNLAGLMLAEVEAASINELQSIELPTWVGREVTLDPFFRGGNLSGLSASLLRDKLASIASNLV